MKDGRYDNLQCMLGCFFVFGGGFFVFFFVNNKSVKKRIGSEATFYHFMAREKNRQMFGLHFGVLFG